MIDQTTGCCTLAHGLCDDAVIAHEYQAGQWEKDNLRGGTFHVIVLLLWSTHTVSTRCEHTANCTRMNLEMRNLNV